MFARTQRLLLRPGFIEDAPELAQAMGHDAVVRNLSSVPAAYTEDDARAFLAMPRDPLHPNFVITQRTGGAPRIIGGAGISLSPDDELQIGYWITPAYWGLGFATEAGRAVLDMARTNRLPRLTASHFIDNQASGAVLRKLGFRPTGRIILRHSPARGNAAPAAVFEEAGDCGADAMGDIGAMRCDGPSAGFSVKGQYDAPARQLAA
jgi:RimJ/RimL family protein N-acetyltransferase